MMDPTYNSKRLTGVLIVLGLNITILIGNTSMATTQVSNAFGAQSVLSTPAWDFRYYRLASLSEAGLGGSSRLPFCLKVLLESLLRNVDGFTTKGKSQIAIWNNEFLMQALAAQGT